MIIVNGKNHWPQDIEWAAEQLEGVKTGDVAAISVPGENAEEVPMLLAQCRTSDAAAARESLLKIYAVRYSKPLASTA